MTRDSERRRADRRRVRVAVRAWNREMDVRGYTSDVSTTGLYMEMHSPPKVGAQLHLLLTFQDAEFVTEASVARVVRVAPEVARVVRSGVGFRFLSLSEIVQKLFSSEKEQHGFAESHDLQVDLTNIAVLETVLQNEVRQGGLFVETSTPYKRDQEVTLRILLPSPHPFLEVKGKVIHIMEKPMQGVGVQLLDTKTLPLILVEVLKKCHK